MLGLGRKTNFLEARVPACEREDVRSEEVLSNARCCFLRPSRSPSSVILRKAFAIDAVGLCLVLFAAHVITHHTSHIR
eukprot:COSAG02_NODE_219_length_28538_cov_79.322058_28_plen_78_part_00